VEAAGGGLGAGHRTTASNTSTLHGFLQRLDIH
jgi:hypothetical protein